MKFQVYIFSFLSLFVFQAQSLTCQQILSSQESFVDRVFSEDEEGRRLELAYLVMLMEYSHEPSIAKLKAETWGYQETLGFKASDEDRVRIMVKLLRYKYTSLERDLLEMGRGSLLAKRGSARSAEENVALALIEVHATSGRGLDFSIDLLMSQSDPLSRWHLAEFLYKKKRYDEAEAALLSTGSSSSKTEEALEAVRFAAKGGVYENVLEASLFDSTQWGPFEP